MKNYFAPEVDILDVLVEQGFAASAGSGHDGETPDGEDAPF